MSDKKVLSFRFGDIIENGWASEDNPTRYGIVVSTGSRTGKMNRGPYVHCTDGNGKFWDIFNTVLDGEYKLKRVGTVLNSGWQRKISELKAAAKSGGTAARTGAVGIS